MQQTTQQKIQQQETSPVHHVGEFREAIPKLLAPICPVCGCETVAKHQTVWSGSRNIYTAADFFCASESPRHTVNLRARNWEEWDALLATESIWPGTNPIRKTKSSEDQSETRTIAQEQIDKIVTLLGKTGIEPIKFCEFFNIEVLSELPVKNYDRAVSLLQKRIEMHV